MKGQVSLFLLTVEAEIVDAQACYTDWSLNSQTKFTNTVMPSQIVMKVCRNFKEGFTGFFIDQQSFHNIKSESNIYYKLLTSWQNGTGENLAIQLQSTDMYMY